MVMKKYQLALFLTAVLALAGIELVSASTYSVTVAQANQTQAAGVFYMAPNGDDTKDGTTIATAWKTGNHQLSCGAKILVQPGAFLGDQRVVLSVQNTCPGPNGELYVTVECSGAHVQDCIVDGQGGAAFDVQISNWLIKHFTATSNVHGTGNGYGACFSAPSDPAHAAAVHHVLFVDIYAHDCVWSGSSSQGDYIAWLGVVLYHSAFQNHDGGGGCPSNISIINNVNHDTLAGPHLYVNQMFSMKAGTNHTCVDGHGLIYDGLNTHGYSGLAVIKDSMFLGNGMAGVHHFNSKSVTFHEDHLTIWGNGQATLAGVVTSDYNFQLSGPAATTNSIIQATVANQSFDPRATCPNAAGGPGEPCPMRYAIGDYYETANISNTDVYAPNGQYCWSYGRYGVCPTGLQYDVMFTGTVNVDPQFVNTATLPSTAPDCSQKTSVNECMAPEIAGFRAQNTTVAGMGYRPPGACAPDADWPTWIPVSLIPDGLVSKPCS